MDADIFTALQVLVDGNVIHDRENGESPENTEQQPNDMPDVYMPMREMTEILPTLIQTVRQLYRANCVIHPELGEHWDIAQTLMSPKLDGLPLVFFIEHQTCVVVEPRNWTIVDEDRVPEDIRRTLLLQGQAAYGGMITVIGELVETTLFLFDIYMFQGEATNCSFQQRQHMLANSFGMSGRPFVVHIPFYPVTQVATAMQTLSFESSDLAREHVDERLFRAWCSLVPEEDVSSFYNYPRDGIIFARGQEVSGVLWKWKPTVTIDCLVCRSGLYVQMTRTQPTNITFANLMRRQHYEVPKVFEVLEPSVQTTCLFATSRDVFGGADTDFMEHFADQIVEFVIRPGCQRLEFHRVREDKTFPNSLHAAVIMTMIAKRNGSPFTFFRTETVDRYWGPLTAQMHTVIPGAHAAFLAFASIMRITALIVSPHVLSRHHLRQQLRQAQCKYGRFLEKTQAASPWEKLFLQLYQCIDRFPCIVVIHNGDMLENAAWITIPEELEKRRHIPVWEPEFQEPIFEVTDGRARKMPIFIPLGRGITCLVDMGPTDQIICVSMEICNLRELFIVMDLAQQAHDKTGLHAY